MPNTVRAATLDFMQSDHYSPGTSGGVPLPEMRHLPVFRARGPGYDVVELFPPATATFIVRLKEMELSSVSWTPPIEGHRFVTLQAAAEVWAQFTPNGPIGYPTEILRTEQMIGTRPRAGDHSHVPPMKTNEALPVLEVAVPPGMEVSVCAPYLEYRLTDPTRQTYVSTYPGSKVWLGPNAHGNLLLDSAATIGRLAENGVETTQFLPAELLTAVGRRLDAEAEHNRQWDWTGDLEPTMSFQARRGALYPTNSVGGNIVPVDALTSAEFARVVNPSLRGGGIEP